MNEEWKDIIGYENMYQISNTGQVRSVDRIVFAGKHYVPTRIKGCIIKTRISKNGYVMVTLSNKSKTKHLYVHRLVAEAFIPNPDNKREVNHKDTNKLNNNVNNLEWTTSSENKIHAHKNGLMDNKYVGAEKRAKKQRIPIIMDDNILCYGVNKTAKKINVCPASITQVLHGERKFTRGHTFKYATDDDIQRLSSL